MGLSTSRRMGRVTRASVRSTWAATRVLYPSLRRLRRLRQLRLTRNVFDLDVERFHGRLLLRLTASSPPADPEIDVQHQVDAHICVVGQRPATLGGVGLAPGGETGYWGDEEARAREGREAGHGSTRGV